MAHLKSMTTDLANSAANKDLSNNLDYTEYREYLLDTLQYMKKLLMPHCGPNASSALIIHEARDGSKVPEFTKDGITIARYLQFVDPAQSTIQKFVVEMGKLIESHAKDGTTTAMILLCSLMEELISTPIDKTPKWLRKLYRKMVSHKFDNHQDNIRLFTDLIRQFVRSEKITCQELADATDTPLEAVEKYVIIQQALLASKGDTELAKCLSYIISNTPRECRKYYSYERATMEMDTRYSVNEVSGLEMAAELTDNSYLNVDNFTAYEQDKVTLFVVKDEFGINAMSTKYILDTAVEQHSGPIVILCHTFDNITANAIDKLNANRENKIVLFTIAKDLKERSYPLALDIVTAYTGTSNLDNVLFAPAGDYCVRNVKVQYKGRRLTLSNLVKETTDNIHPFYRNEEKYKDYHDLVKWLKSKVSETNVIYTEQDLHERDACLTGLKNLVQLKKYNLCIGGKALDNIQNVSVVEDTYGAVLKVLDEPFVIGGFYNLYLYFKECSKTQNLDPFVYNCLEDILKTVYTPTQIKEIHKSRYSKHTSLLYNKARDTKLFDILQTKRFIKQLALATLPEEVEVSDSDPIGPTYELEVLVHPIAFFEELARMLEVTCTKLLDNERVLIPNVIIKK